MALVGIIHRRRPISKAEWLECVAAHPILVGEPARDVINPFTGTETRLPPIPSNVGIRSHGLEIGRIEDAPTFDDDGKLLVYATAETELEVRKVANEIARHLKAKLTWFEGVF